MICKINFQSCLSLGINCDDDNEEEWDDVDEHDDHFDTRIQMIMTKSHLPAIFVVEDPNGSVQGSLHFVHNLRRDRFKLESTNTTTNLFKGELTYCSTFREEFHRDIVFAIALQQQNLKFQTTINIAAVYLQNVFRDIYDRWINLGFVNWGPYIQVKNLYRIYINTMYFVLESIDV